MTDHTTCTPHEQWKNIPGYEGLYQVSNLGQVRRLPKKITTKSGWNQVHHGGIKKLGTRNGYHYLWLFKSNVGKKFYVHELVAAAFICDRPRGYDIHHINHNRLDNRPENLQYISRGKHAMHHSAGEKSSSSKVTESQVRQIKTLCKTMRVVDVARKLGISYHIAWQVSHGKTWKHVK